MPKSLCEGSREYLMQARRSAGYVRREDAACYVPFSATTIGRHERNALALLPQDAELYAEAYDAPELLMQYCHLDCPIGAARALRIRDNAGIALLSTRFGNRMRELAGAANRLAAIADDDIVDPTERPEFEEILCNLRELSVVFQELELYALKKPALSGADGCKRAAH